MLEKTCFDETWRSEKSSWRAGARTSAGKLVLENCIQFELQSLGNLAETIAFTVRKLKSEGMIPFHGQWHWKMMSRQADTCRVHGLTVRTTDGSLGKEVEGSRGLRRKGLHKRRVSMEV